MLINIILPSGILVYLIADHTPPDEYSFVKKIVSPQHTAKPGAEDWRAENTVDLEETARAVNGLIKGGVNGILAMGTLGECAALTWEKNINSWPHWLTPPQGASRFLSAHQP